ncbi:hypothetical protein [Sedimentisphaera salicampi]|uniref:Uncharacterized protein n=1 Tax=Sedimentisphaera salicampi TaxID=1941349 RepID=A0A1W6LLX4_9BACT|nr:hypothetical protein [Sedimentisphaera salicampi]ARN56752.1 hypothetical protein STSP1_01143 [Sedimentisphaera salicampi]OXU15193.1 hypothetical protein SMSP1_01125 [Sedimentisphaera salicampi]
MRKTALFLILTASLLIAADEVFDEPDGGKQRGRMQKQQTGKMYNRMLEKIAEEDKARAEKLRTLREENPKEFHEEMKEMLKGKMGRPDFRGHDDHHRPGERRFEPGERFRAKFKERFAKRNDEFIEWLEENFPEEAEKMEKAFEADPNSAFKNTAYIRNKYRRIFEIEKRHPEMAELMKNDLELKERRDQITKQLRSCEDEQEKKELKNELRDIVSMRFNVILEKRRLKLEDLKEKLKQIEKEINKQQNDLETLDDQRDSLIKSRMEELVEESKKQKVDWE